MSEVLMRGILPPVLTPFTPEGEVDFDAFQRNLARWKSAGVGGYLVLGSNSETPYLKEEEKLRLVSMAVQGAAKNTTVLAGTGLESTKGTIELTNKAARLGAQGALIITPCFYGQQMNDEALFRHYARVADAADIPIFIYNVPKFTRLQISKVCVARLIEHPRVAGIKDSGGSLSQLQWFREFLPASFRVIVGSGSLLYEALKLGIDTAILAVANCAPDECVKMTELFSRKDFAGCEEAQKRISVINAAVTDMYGIAGLKYASTKAGYEGGCVRSPLMELSEGERRGLEELLRSVNFTGV